MPFSAFPVRLFLVHPRLRRRISSPFSRRPAASAHCKGSAEIIQGSRICLPVRSQLGHDRLVGGRVQQEYFVPSCHWLLDQGRPRQTLGRFPDSGQKVYLLLAVPPVLDVLRNVSRRTRKIALDAPLPERPTPCASSRNARVRQA